VHKSGLQIALLPCVLGNWPFLKVQVFQIRFRTTGQARLFDTSAQVPAALGGASYEDLQSTAYLERAEVIGLPLDRLGGPRGEISLRSYSADRIILGVSADSPSILIATNNYSPYWKARVGGVEAV
jgi:hypothetical protein